jgi:hypothetical protein
MILQSESGLSPADYASMIAAFGDPIARVTLEQYSLSLTQQAGGGAGAANESFDAIVVGDVVVRAWATTNTITVEALASEDDSDQSWSSQNLTATSIDTDVGLSFASSGDTVRVFWWDGSFLRYFESTDKGSSWGPSTPALSKSTAYKLAATSLTRVHSFSQVSGGSYRLHVAEYDGSWSETDSDIYWPFLPGSFDAIAIAATDDAAAAASDVLAFSTDFPPMIQVGVENTEITRDYERVRGIAVFRYQNGNWSNHYSVDTIDNLYGESEREHVRLSGYDDLIFLTYRRVDGDLDYSHTSIAVSRSKTGVHWEQPYILGDITNAPATLIKRGEHAYILSAEDTWRSPSSRYTGDSRVTQDVSDRMMALTSRMGDIQEIQITLANPDGVLDNTSPLDDDVSIQAVIQEGWVVGGAELLVQTARVDIDSISQSLQIPTNHKILVGRDVLGRLLTINADYVQEWESQQVSGDNYQGADTTKYSGMHHTAAVLGHWETEDNTLKLTSSKVPGIAFHTGVSNAWNGSARAKCKASATDSADYVGLVFRAHDYENLWYVAYDADDDVIRLVDRRLNIDDVRLESSAMGWFKNTFYGLQVDFNYNKVDIYTSTDFVNYLHEMSYTMQGVSVPGSTWGSIPIMAGSMGYLGFGFSPTQTGGWPPVPDPPPWPQDPVVYPSTVSDWPNEMYAGTWEMGIYYTADMTGPDVEDQPTWTPINAGLPSTDDGGETRYFVRQLILDPILPRTYQYVLMGDSTEGSDVYRRSYGGTWAEILTVSEAEALCPGISAGDGAIYWLATNQDTSETYAGHLYAVVAERAFDGAMYIVRSYDYGSNWEPGESIIDVAGKSFYRVGNLVVHGEVQYVGWNGSGSNGRISYKTSEDAEWQRSDSLGGSIWTPYLAMSNLQTDRVYINNNATKITIQNLGFFQGNGERLQPLPYKGSDAGDVITIAYYDEAYDFYGLNDLGPERPDALWHSAYRTNYARLIRDNKLYVTTTRWWQGPDEVVKEFFPTELDPTGFGTIASPVEDDESKIFLGRTEFVSISKPTHVHLMDSETETEPTSKSGVDPENDLTTVSIPYTGDGLCYGGLQPITWL